MRYYLITVNYNQTNLNNTAVALGKFQGLHKGHMLLVDKILELASDFELTSVVFSINFNEDKVINLPYEKQSILKKCGVDYLVNCDFCDEFASMSPEEFVLKILVNKLGVSYVVVGSDFRFGKGRAGDVSVLRTYALKYGFKLVAIDKLAIDDIIVSSTYIRELISNGNMKNVYKFMGRYYSLSGRVIRGRQLGRTIGFPTVNIIPDPHKLLPPYGVYGSMVELDGTTYPAITNVGNNPTIDSDNAVTVESNIIDFSEEIYDRDITIYFTDYIRGEIKFNNIEALKKQINNDKMKFVHQ